MAGPAQVPPEIVLRVDALNEEAWGLRAADAHRAHALAQEARTLAAEHGYTLGRARAARTLGMTLDGEAVLADVVRYGEEAKEAFDAAGDDEGRAASRDFLSSIHEHIGDLVGGLDLALDALSIARKLGDPVRQGYALSSVGGCLAAAGETDGAVEHLVEGLELFRSIDDPVGVAVLSSRLSKVFKTAGRYEEALEYASLCREAAEEAENEWPRVNASLIMAELEEERGRPADAERRYREALASITNPVIRRFLGSEIRIALAKLLIRRDELDEAEQHVRSAQSELLDEAISIVNLMSADEALADIHERRGDFQSALAHLRQAERLRSQIYQRESRNKVAQLEVRAAMEAAKKDAEIHRLRFVELHSMQSKVVEAERMAVLGKLAAGTAHELNTPLGVLRSHGQLIEKAAQRLLARVPQGDPQAARLAAAITSSRAAGERAIERISAIAENFGRFSRLDRAERGPVDVREGLRSAVDILRPTFSSDVAWTLELENAPPVEGWSRELNHAFLTVLQNAAQALEGPGVVTVQSGLHDDGWVVVRVSDSGRGMTEAQLGRLFDVDWSVEGPRTKMRLGLIATASTIQAHGGSIDVESRLGEGTIVTFRLPPRPSAKVT